MRIKTLAALYFWILEIGDVAWKRSIEKWREKSENVSNKIRQKILNERFYALEAPKLTRQNKTARAIWKLQKTSVELNKEIDFKLKQRIFDHRFYITGASMDCSKKEMVDSRWLESVFISINITLQDGYKFKNETYCNSITCYSVHWARRNKEFFVQMAMFN